MITLKTFKWNFPAVFPKKHINLDENFLFFHFQTTTKKAQFLLKINNSKKMTIQNIFFHSKHFSNWWKLKKKNIKSTVPGSKMNKWTTKGMRKGGGEGKHSQMVLFDWKNKSFWLFAQTKPRMVSKLTVKKVIYFFLLGGMWAEACEQSQDIVCYGVEIALLLTFLNAFLKFSEKQLYRIGFAIHKLV